MSAHSHLEDYISPATLDRSVRVLATQDASSPITGSAAPPCDVICGQAIDPMRCCDNMVKPRSSHRISEFFLHSFARDTFFASARVLRQFRLFSKLERFSRVNRYAFLIKSPHQSVHFCWTLEDDRVYNHVENWYWQVVSDTNNYIFGLLCAPRGADRTPECKTGSLDNK